MRAKPAHATVLGLTLLLLVLRVAVWTSYRPIPWPDTGTYTTLAQQLATGDFAAYTGARTPVYPIVLLLLNFDPAAVWRVQSVVGLAIFPTLVFSLAPTVGGPAKAALLAAPSAFALNQIFGEANLLTETLASFLLALSVLLLTSSPRGAACLTRGCALGAVSALAALTRPLYVYLGPLYLLLLILRFGRSVPRIFLASFVSSFLLPVLGWATLNAILLGSFGLTTTLGYNLTQHSGGFIEHASAPYAQLRDVYLTHRQRAQKEEAAENGEPSMVIWRARAEIKAATGLSDVELSKRLAAMSLDLFIRYPTLYLISAARAWIRFWSAPNYWLPGEIKPGSLRRILLAAWSIQLWLLRLANLCLVLSAPFWLLLALRSRDAWLSFPVAALLVTLSASVLQALVELGENGRYSLPTQPLTVTTAVVTGTHVARRLIRRANL